MKRFLPLVLAAGVLLLSGCHTADVPEATLPDAHGAGGEHGATGHEVAGNEAASHGADGHETNGTYPTAAAFPSSTPPSGKESVTPKGYWGPRKVNTEPTDAHAGGGHANTAHGGAEGHGDEAGHGETGASH
jgi:hypothetical protein